MAKKKVVNMYQIVDTHDHSVVEEGFANRQDAKPRRNELNKEAGRENPDNPRYIVSRGKDHIDGPSNGITKLVRGKNSYF